MTTERIDCKERGMAQPIDLYFWPTPNGWKIAIFLEEAGLPYNVVPVDITAGEQFEDEFLKISPNNQIPAIVDPEGPGGDSISVFESGAILIYLAEKTGLFYPQEPRKRYEVLGWLMFQMGSEGPMLGQAHHFRNYAPEGVGYAYERYTNEASRIYRVMERGLVEGESFAAGEYTIADMALYPWVFRENQGLEDYPNLNCWYEEMRSRPAVQRALNVGSESSKQA